MKLCISNYGLNSNNPGQPGPCLKGTIELVNDSTLFEHEVMYNTGKTTVLTFILLDPLSDADIARLAKNDDTLVIGRICNNLINEELIPRHSVDRISTLTATELLVLSILAENKKDREIAEALHVDRETIKTHCSKIYKKTGLHSRVLVSFAFMIFKARNPDWMRKIESKQNLKFIYYRNHTRKAAGIRQMVGQRLKAAGSPDRNRDRRSAPIGSR